MRNLHVDSLTKHYDNRRILSNIYISCNKGEIKGLLGRNGSGKSTLLKIIFGTEPADFKFVKVGNKIIKNLYDGRNIINYLPQDNFLPNNIKIKNLIKLFLPKNKRNRLIENEFIKPLLNKNNQELSGGQRRVIEILLIINSEADFILLDEPFNGVSPIIRNIIKENIVNLKKEKGFIITDHDYKNVIDIADDIVLLQNGSLQKADNSSDLIKFGYLRKPTCNTV